MCRGQTHTDRRRHPCTSPHTRGLANKVIPTLAPHRTGLTLAELRIGKGLFLCKIQNINSEFLEKSGNKDWGSEEVGNLANLQLKKGVSISLAIDLASVAKCHWPLVSATAWSQKKYLCCCCQSSELSSGASSQLIDVEDPGREQSHQCFYFIWSHSIYHLPFYSTQFYDSTLSSIPHRNWVIKYEYFAQFLINIFETLTRIYDKFKLTFVWHLYIFWTVVTSSFFWCNLFLQF